MAYSEELNNYLKNVNFNNKSIYDIGANEGYMIDFFLNNSKGSEIYGVEPHPSNITILNKKFKNKKVVKIIHGAVNDYDGDCLIGFEEQERKNGLKQGHVTDTNNDLDLQGRDWNKKSIVKSYKLDKLCENADIIKMDIEGFEHKLLPQLLINMKNTKTWLIEIHSWEDINYHGWTAKKHNKNNDSLNKMIKLFLKNGFNNFVLAKKRNINKPIDKNIYWTDIPISSYIKDKKKIYYKVVNLIIKK